jgi:hypothetical protein
MFHVHVRHDVDLPDHRWAPLAELLPMILPVRGMTKATIFFL